MNSKLKITVVIIFLISACRKEPINHNISAEKPGQNVSLTLADAKEFISQINPDSAKVLTKIKIDWKLAQNDTTNDRNKWTVVLEGQPTYQGYKQGYRELVILKDNDSRKIGAKILEILPEAIYLQKTRKTSAADFTGRVFEYDLNYNLTGGRLYSNGKPIGLIKQFSQQEQTTQTNQGLKEINPFNGAQGKLMLYAVAFWPLGLLW